MAHLRDRCLDNVIFPALSSVPFLAPQLPFLLPRNHTGTPFRHDITPREERMAVDKFRHLATFGVAVLLLGLLLVPFRILRIQGAASQPSAKTIFRRWIYQNAR